MDDLSKYFYYEIKKEENVQTFEKVCIDKERLKSLIQIMFITLAVTIIMLFIIIIVIKNGQNVFVNLISDNNSVNIVFSLVLSSLLETLYQNVKTSENKNAYIIIHRSITQRRNKSTAWLIVSALFGVILYTTYAITLAKFPDNAILKYAFIINIIYIVISFIAIGYNFIAQSSYIKKYTK